MAGIDLALWIATGLLGVAYLMAGSMKLMQPTKMQAQTPVLAALPLGQIKAIGALEILGVFGIVVPPAVDFMPWVAAVSASGLALIQVLAIPRHIKMKDTKGLPFNSILLAMALFVVLGRSGALP